MAAQLTTVPNHVATATMSRFDAMRTGTTTLESLSVSFASSPPIRPSISIMRSCSAEICRNISMDEDTGLLH